MNSHNHIMFGSVDAWFYKNLAGLEILEPGWKVFQVKPYVALERVKCQLKTILGEIALSWQKSESEFLLDLSLPVGSRAKLFFPVLWPEFLIEESGRAIWAGEEFIPAVENTGISPAELNQSPVFWVEPGRYNFRVRQS